MRIECSRSGVIDVYRADHANFPDLLCMKLLCNGLVFNCTALVHIDHTGIGLLAGSNGSCCRGRIRGKAAGIISYC